MNPAVIPKILQAYGVPYRQLLPPQKGYRNTSHPIELASGHRVNLLLYKQEPGILPRIRRANAVAAFLAAQHYPARSVYDPRILVLQAGERRTYTCLYHYLPGSTIPWEAYTKEHIKQLGGAMSDMHGLLRLFTAPQLPHVADEYIAIVHRMHAYFADAGVSGAMLRKLGLTVDPGVFLKLHRLLTACKQLPHAQALHMDFVRGNILFDTRARITGVLDFEKTAKGHPAFDIARTLAFLLVDCKYKTPGQVRKYFLYSGYQKRGHAALPPVRLIDALVPLFLFYDFYKFLRHNPYESLAANEHYTRTRNILLNHTLLSPSPVPCKARVQIK